MLLLERELELERLLSLASEVGDHGGKVVLIRGEAGIGKSALVASFLDQLSAETRTFIGYCDDLQTPQPFGPLWDVSRDRNDLGEALRNRDRQAAFESFFDLLASTLRLNIVVIEDTQWSDEASLDAIKYVGRRIARTNGLLLLTYRDGEVDLNHPLRTVIGDLHPQSVERIELSGLSRSAVSEIVKDAGLDPDEILKLTRGNPFFVSELAMADAGQVPVSVSESVMARVGRLSPEATRILRILSVVPERVDRNEVAAMAVSSEVELAECERLGLLEIGEHTLSFRHGLIRRAVEDSLTTSESIAIHREFLQRLPPDYDPVRLVHHAQGARDVERLIEAAPLAARAAAAVASHREASAHYRSVEAYLDRVSVKEKGKILLEWARIEFYLAEVKAVEIVERAVNLYREPTLKLELARALTLAVVINEAHGRTQGAEGQALEAIAILRTFGPSSDLATTLSRYADLLVHQGEGVSADGAVDEAIAMGIETGNELAQIRALNVKGMLALVRGRPGGLGLIEQSRGRAESGGYRFEQVMALRGAAYIAQEINDVELQGDFSSRARDTAIRYELPLLESEANAVLADSLMRKGNMAAAEDLATESLGSHANADLHFMRVLGIVRIRSGRSGGQEYLGRAWLLAKESTEIDYLLHVAASLVEEMWLSGQVDSDMTERFGKLVHRGIRQEFPWLAGWLAFWLWKVAEFDQIPDGVPQPHVQATNGEYISAGAFWLARHMPYEQAMALNCGPETSRLEALKIVEGLGADGAASRIRRDLRDDGVSVPRGKGRSTRSHIAGLTARQGDVLQLLQEDLTNVEIADRLFVSPRTVENHVSAILAKLNASTRGDAVSRGVDLGLLSG